MKKSTTLKSLLFLFILFASFSCSNSKEYCLGCQDDTIGLSKNEISFNAEDNWVIVTTSGTDWRLGEIIFNGIALDITQVNQSKKDFIIEEDEFIFERRSSKEIYIQMKKNDTSSERKLYIGLMHLNYGANLFITQSAN